MKMRIKYSEQANSDDVLKVNNHIAIYLFGIKIKKIKIERKVHSKKYKNKNLNTIYMIIKQVLSSFENEEIIDLVSNIIKTIKVQRLDLNFGINFSDPILNAYTIAFINSILPLYLSKNNKKVNLNKIRYYTFISNKTLYVDVDSLISISIRKNFFMILKILYVIVKDRINQRNKDRNINKQGSYENDLNQQYS